MRQIVEARTLTHENVTGNLVTAIVSTNSVLMHWIPESSEVLAIPAGQIIKIQICDAVSAQIETGDFKLCKIKHNDLKTDVKSEHSLDGIPSWANQGNTQYLNIKVKNKLIILGTLSQKLGLIVNSATAAVFAECKFSVEGFVQTLGGDAQLKAYPKEIM